MKGFFWVLMGALVHQKKSLVILLVKHTKKFCLGLHYNSDNNYLSTNGKETFKSKADNNNVNFTTQFCLESTSPGLSTTEST